MIGALEQPEELTEDSIERIWGKEDVENKLYRAEVNINWSTELQFPWLESFPTTSNFVVIRGVLQSRVRL